MTQHVSCQHFRSEFVRQSQATIMRKVTMTQFLFVLAGLGLGALVLQTPVWALPLFAISGYVAGYNYHGEFVYRRVTAYATVWLRLAINRPRIINVQAEWDQTASKTAVQRKRSLRTITLVQ